MKRYYIHNRDRQIHITEWGDPAAPVIFCLHGLGSTGLSFIEIAEELKGEYRILSIDAPGHGLTPPFQSGEQYEMERMADWLNELIEMLDIHSFYFLSHSWGSFVALFYAAKYPSKIKGNILIDGGYQGKRHSNQTLEEEVAFYEEDFEQVFDTWDDFLSLVKSETLNWSSAKWKAAKDLALYKDNRYYWHARGKTAGYIIQAMHKDEVEDIYQDISGNILLMKATLPERLEDHRSKTAAIFREKTNGEVLSVPGTTHLLHWDRPEAVIKEIRKRWES
ncbi:alpha/beta hydrolase (plasmid) [Cytobacillus spongiae]|uniref:alpha/beta fold hydrolase n=1 Tax=Cytobacillus spongiae TaxID=2901381 RepID=UPI001F1E387A|nr:alpha/beta hydrolase [Cytobacillus spongiae]UII58296.1 alpha/beta hydrolase [Cytobacillus spongiae]